MGGGVDELGSAVAHAAILPGTQASYPDADYPVDEERTVKNRAWRWGGRLAIVAAILAIGSAAVGGEGSPGLESLARLRAGNARFVTDASEALPIDGARRAALVAGQTPFASVLSCADSRVPPEVIFHTGLGDLFVVRAAGEVVDKSVIASLEYGAEHLHTPLLVVMGHEFCGAVKTAIDTPAGVSMGPNLDFLLKAIQPSVARTASTPDKQRLRAAILDNVEEQINDLVKESAILRHLSQTGALTVVGGYYELSSGRVLFSDVIAPSAPVAHEAAHHD